MFLSLFSNPLEFFMLVVSLVICITIHECAHALMADHLGDPTPRSQGRISLNPLRHLDLLGSLMMLFTGFGWGKSVMFDPYNLKHPKRDIALISLAGPASNILLAVLLSLVLHHLPLPSLLINFLRLLTALNINLAVFNLIPIHPLDGGKILIAILPDSIAAEWDQVLNKYGLLILLFLLFPFGNSQSPISYLMTPIRTVIFKLLLS